MINWLQRILIFILMWLMISVKVWAADSFVVRAIKVKGLQRHSEGDVLNYLPIQVNDTLNESRTASLIRSLYSSGYFADVSLSRSGDTLIVTVVERSTIEAVRVKGNDLIKTKDIVAMFKAAGVGKGEVYNHAAVETLTQQLKREYFQQGRYNADVKVSTTPSANNRLIVNVTISEGSIARIREIKIIGNKAFSEFTLLRHFHLSKHHLWSVFTKNDLYTKDKMKASLDALNAIYQNHGYIHFTVDSTQVSITPDHTCVYIVIKVTEGQQYYFSGFKLKGDLILKEKELNNLVNIHQGAVFSRQVIEDANQDLGLALGAHGYAFAHIEPIPTIDEKNRTVFITFFITPGHKVYVRRVNFTGHTLTADYVIRHAVQQMEGSLMNVAAVRESVRQMNMMGYFKNVNVKTTPVPGTTNQVDLDYGLEEANSGEASVSVGLQSINRSQFKFSFGAAVNQPNFLGSGRTVGLSFNRDPYNTSLNLNYFNPYFTTTGIGHGVNVYAQRTDPGAVNLSEYSYNTYGISTYLSIPLSLYDSIQVGGGFNHIDLNVNKNQLLVPILINQFVNENGRDFNQLKLTGAYTHFAQDRAIFPTAGLTDSLNGMLSLPTFGDSLKFYKVDYRAQYYQPLNRAHSFVLEADGGVAFGYGYNGNTLPFFENYYAGGLSNGRVRGFVTNTLGPQATLPIVINAAGQAATYGRPEPIGGNLLVHASAALIFPNFVSESLRTDVFVDAGNVYQTSNLNRKFGQTVLTDAGPIRYAVGVGLEWRSPFGPFSFSLAEPINEQKGDAVQIFQFTMGTSI